MENTKPTQPQTEPQAEDILEKARANKKRLVTLGIFLAAAVVVAIVWIFVAQNGSRKADELVAKADLEQNDSIATTLYAKAAEAGYKSGNRAKAEMGIRLYKEGKYEEALKYLGDASLGDEIAAAGVYALQGDCYVNLDQNDKALSCFDDAIDAADENPQIVPLILIKKANIYRAQGKFAEEAKAYKEIIDEYPQYVRMSQTDIRKYYERAQAAASAK